VPPHRDAFTTISARITSTWPSRRWPPDRDAWPLAQARQHRDGTAGRVQIDLSWPTGLCERVGVLMHILG
jgi:hypothetical protein